MRGDFPPGCSSNVIARWHPGQIGRFREPAISTAPYTRRERNTLSHRWVPLRGGDSRNRRPCWRRKAIQFGAGPASNNSPSVGEITGAIISSDAVAGRIWHPMTKPPTGSSPDATFVRLKCRSVLGYCNFQLQCSATKHYSVWGRCAFRPVGKGTRRRSAFQDLVAVSLIVAD